MKHHITLQLNERIQGQPAPPWELFVRDKSRIITSLGGSIDTLLKDYGLTYWVTSEYAPAEMSAAKHKALGHSARPPPDYSELEETLGLDRTYRVILREDRKVPHGLVEALSAHPRVRWANSPVVAQTQLPERRPARRTDAVNWPAQMIRLNHAHAISQGDPQIKIAILDTGVDVDHPELAGKIVAQKDVVNFDGLDTTNFVGDLLDADSDPDDDVGHGTHVAGILGARGQRVSVGVCPSCSLIAVRVLAALMQNGRRVGAGLLDNINTGIKWAVDSGANIINMSLGVRHDHGGLPHQDIIEYAQRHGVVIVAAAGNDGSANKYYPGALSGVVAVGAADSDGRVARFSSFGAPISFLAPGTRIISSFRDGGYVASSGTSQAAPFVSGAFALLKSIGLKYGRTLDNNQVLRLLHHTADRVNDRARDRKAGFGVINLADAVKLLQYELSY